MEQKPASNIPPIRVVQPQPSIQYFIGPRGLIFILLGLLVLFIGGVGYLEYDHLVKPYLPVYICCIPAIILAGLLIFFGFATKFTTIRQVKIQRPSRQSIPDDQVIDLTRPGAEFSGGAGKGQGGETYKHEVDNQDSLKRSQRKEDLYSNGPRTATRQQAGMRKFESGSTTEEELLAQKRNLNQFLKNLDEQHDDGLLMNNVYSNLKMKYNHELSDINSRLKLMGEKKAKKTKMKKKE